MYKKNKPNKTSLVVRNSFNGETIEEKVRRIVNNKEPITDGAPLIYTERKDGVQPAYDIRTDKFEPAIAGMGLQAEGLLYQREEKNKDNSQIGKDAVEGMKKEGETK